MTQVILKVVEAPESLPVVIDATEEDLFHTMMLAGKVYKTLPDDQFGNATVTWTFHYPTLNDVITDGESLRNAVQAHGANSPILLKTNFKVGFGQRIGRYLTSKSVNSRGRPIRNYFEFDQGIVRVTPDMPYMTPITFGQYIEGGCRPDCPMDAQPILLNNFKPKFRTQFVATLTAKVYEAVYGPTVRDHALTRFLQSKTFAKAYCRVERHSRTNNVVTGDTQTGKSKEITVSAIMSLFLGRDSLVYVRNNGGAQPKETFRKDLQEFVSLVKDYAENVLEVSMESCEDLFDSINIYTESTGRTEFQSPLIYVDRTNPTRLNYPVKHIYPTCSRDRYCLFIDEIDEQQSSKDGTRGKTENLLFNVTQQTAEDKTIFSNAHLMMGFTATPYATLSVAPVVENEEYTNNVIRMPIPSDYKGYASALPEERKITIIETPEKVSKSSIPGYKLLSMKDLLLQTDRGIKDMFDHMVLDFLFDGYVSALITCSTLHKNDDKRRAAEALVQLDVDFPIVAFAHDQEGEKHIFFSPWFAKKGVDFEQVNSLGGHPVVIKAGVVEVKLPKEMRTVHVMYDICQAFYQHATRSLGFEVQPFMFCVSLTLANRGITFKTSAHGFPLTHMYASTKSAMCKYAMDIKQIAGRLCSRDSLGRKRYLFATPEFKRFLEESYKVDNEVLATYDAPRTFTETIIALPETGVVAKNAHYESRKLPLLKRRHADEVCAEVTEHKAKRRRHEYNDAGSSSRTAVENEVVGGHVMPPRFIVDPRDHTQQIAVARALFNLNFVNVKDTSTGNDVIDYLVSSDYIQMYPEGQPKPLPISLNHFVVESCSEELLHVRIRSALVYASRQYSDVIVKDNASNYRMCVNV